MVMGMSKKSLFVSMLLLSSTAAHSMFDDPDKIFLVHASKVMPENNTKIAGAQMHPRDGSSSYVEAAGTNLRKRMTYHSSINGMVPETSIGRMVSAGIAVASDLHTNKDICAYLDPLSAFKGEVFGGTPDDFMTIDGHTYGKSSIIIVPDHKKEEFHEKNPHYSGTLVVYDPSLNSLREKVEETIARMAGAHTFTEINDKRNWEEYVNFCKKYNYSHKYHASTPFMLLEEALKDFHQTVDFINRKCDTIPLLSADQVEPLSTVIETTLDHIEEKLYLRLSTEKYKVIESWIVDTKNWLTFFKIDARLRLTESKSLFKNHLDDEEKQQLIRHRHDIAFIEKMGRNLPSLTSVTYDHLSLPYTISATSHLRTEKSEALFPENSVGRIFQLPLAHIQHLYHTLIQKGYSAHADEILLNYFMNIFESNNEKKKTALLRDGEELFIKLLSHLTPSDSLQKRLQDWAWSALCEDASFRNHRTISLFNSPAGKALRQKIWGDQSTLDFWTLLNNNPGTAILFKDLENEDFGFKSDSEAHLSSGYRRFTHIVRRWLLERARKNSFYIPECTALISVFSQPKSMGEEIKNPHCSLFNMAYTEEIAKKLLPLYTMDLNRDVRDPNNSLQALIDQGCFKSWGDLLAQLYDLKELDEDELSEILKEEMQNVSIMNLGIKIKSYLSQRQNEMERFEDYKPIYEEIVQQIETAGERPIEVNSLWGGGLEWYIDTLLDQCIHGFTQEIGKNKVTILPNWDQAKILYKRLYEVANSDERIKLDAMMETIFKTQ